MIELKSGDQFGNWELINCLGKGGNGEVWKAKNANNEIAAIKISTKPKISAFERFKAEVQVHLDHSDILGVLPVLDHLVTEEFDDENPSWFVMPLAKPFKKAVRNEFRLIIIEIGKVSETLWELHERGVVHRDLKPENLLYYEGHPQVGDFGIADFPDKPDLTRDNQKLGAYWTIAPEMERNPKTADGKKADVYSLAKTLWMLLVNDKRSFAGQYLPGRRPMALSAFHADIPILHVIEGLLGEATANSPDERPDMDTFLKTLGRWVEDSQDYRQVSLVDWEALQRFLFPVTIPQSAAWTQLEDIVSVINILGQNAELNRAFSPDGGGLDLVGAKFSVEDNCIELRFEANMFMIVKPRVLMFESMPGFAEWSYFRLETRQLTPSGVYEGLTGTFEEVLEIAPGDYTSRTVFDQGFIYGPSGEEIPLPEDARVITRQFGGSFVVFAKASHYNEIDNYKGTHNKISADKFRKEIESVVDQYGLKLRAAMQKRRAAQNTN